MAQHLVALDGTLGIEAHEHYDVATEAALVGRLHGSTYPRAVAGYLVHDEAVDILLGGGDLFIGTDRGLISYTTDATRGESQYTEEKVYAYPNPVNPDYDGLITIVGLKVNSNVKITNTAGRLVAEGTSLGGTFTWNGRTAQGQRVATGIYYVLGTDEEGREGIVTKILFIQ